jgi:hypothetical protein
MYKAIGIFWTTATVGVVVFSVIGTHNFWGLALLILTIPFIGLTNIYQIRYDQNNIYIRKWRECETIELLKVKSINAGDPLSWDPFFQLEIVDHIGEIRKVNFMPDMIESFHYLFTKRFIGQLLDFKIQIRNRSVK